jgi:hypothetical protein
MHLLIHCSRASIHHDIGVTAAGKRDTSHELEDECHAKSVAPPHA